MDCPAPAIISSANRFFFRRWSSISSPFLRPCTTRLGETKSTAIWWRAIRSDLRDQCAALVFVLFSTAPRDLFLNFAITLWPLFAGVHPPGKNSKPKSTVASNSIGLPRANTSVTINKQYVLSPRFYFRSLPTPTSVLRYVRLPRRPFGF